MEELNIKTVQQQMWDCVRKETIKANKDLYGIEWI